MKRVKAFGLILCLLGLIFSHRLQANDSLIADYVLVGVGTSGPVMAKMLTDDKKTSLIALHNGENMSQDPLIKFSKNASTTVLDSLIGLPFYENGVTVPQVNADNREILWAMAVPAGGASSINAGAYCRGTKKLYAEWERIAGSDWSVNRIVSIYKDLETYQGKSEDPKSRGKHGPLNVLQVPKTKLSKILTHAVTEATGFSPVLDYNDYNTPIGPSAQFQETQKGPNGRRRVSSVNAFLGKNVMTPDGQGVDGRKLQILFKTTALKTIWEGNKAVEVQYLQEGEIKSVFARKGVIVCAGLQSSFFLLHSGVGPRNVLEPLGVPVVFDNANVGQGLVDQPSLVMAFTANPKDFPEKLLTLFKQISWFPDPIGDQNIRQLRLAFGNPVLGLMIGVFDLVQPKSRGFLSINSPNPLDPPVIDLGDFTDSSDLHLFKRGLQTYIKRINIALHTRDSDYELIDPSPNILDDDVKVVEFIKSRVSSNQSFQSHCRMVVGRTVDEAIQKGGVVDNRGHVYGVQNLIVADNSVVPLCMDGSAMATAYLIPWNIAEMLIKAEKARRE